MKKLVLFVLMLAVINNAAAQKAAVEDFINQVYPTVVPANFSYYNLADSSIRVHFTSYSFDKSEQDSVIKHYPDFPISFFLQAVATTRRVNWREYKLINARIYTRAALPSLPVSYVIYKRVPFNVTRAKLDSLNRHKDTAEIIVPARDNWKQNRFLKAAKKAAADYINTVKPEDRIGYYFSNPLFSPDGRYAIVALHQSDRGATYIFKRNGSKWIEIFLFNRSVS